MKQKIALTTILLFTLMLTACSTTNQVVNKSPTEDVSPTQTPLPKPTFADINRYFVPSYYSVFYINTIQASQQEDGLIIYSAVSKENWQPILEAFNDHYPWINVQVIELDSLQVFERYEDEEAANLRTADLIVSSDSAEWLEFIQLAHIRTYASPESAFLPEWSQPSVGIYTLAPDPLILIYNKTFYPIYNKDFNSGSLITPASMQSLTKTIQENRVAMFNRVGSLSVETNQLALASNWAYLDTKGPAGQQSLTIIGNSVPLMFASDKSIIEYVADGRLYAAYFVPSSTVFSELPSTPFVDFVYLTDGQPVIMQNIAITQAGSSPESAKLLLDYILSQEGQLALSLGSLTPYRADVETVANKHFNKVIREIGGERKLIFVIFNPNLRNEALKSEFIKNWKSTLNQ